MISQRKFEFLDLLRGMQDLFGVSRFRSSDTGPILQSFPVCFLKRRVFDANSGDGVHAYWTRKHGLWFRLYR
jgi:hypothetical protein